MVERPTYQSAQTFKNLLRKTIVWQEVFAKITQLRFLCRNWPNIE